MIEDMVRRHLKSFVPYTSARNEVHNAEILLDANELSLGSPVELNGIELNRYPDPDQIQLRTRLASLRGMDRERIFVGAGSDEIIDLLIRLFCEPQGDSVVVIEPTYGVYRVAANINNVDVVPVELDKDFQIDVANVLRSLKPSTKIIFLCSPNNPTGNLLDHKAVTALCEQSERIVVVDQAYTEFADPSGDLSNEAARFENLVLLRTLSKAWGLAGIRLGYGIAHPMIVSRLLQIKAPYNINAVTSQLAIEALGHSDFLRTSQMVIRDERVKLARGLTRLPCVRHVYPSDANFLLIRFRDAVQAYGHLASQGVIVRRRTEARLKDCLRITVGTPAENEKTLRALEECS